jgi:hypothetical protein
VFNETRFEFTVKYAITHGFVGERSIFERLFVSGIRMKTVLDEWFLKVFNPRFLAPTRLLQMIDLGDANADGS